MTSIIRAGFVTDADTYVNGIIRTEVDTMIDAVIYIARFVDELKKGWHIQTINYDADKDAWTVEVYKRA